MSAPEEKKCTCGCQACRSGNHCGNYGAVLRQTLTNRERDAVQDVVLADGQLVDTGALP